MAEQKVENLAVLKAVLMVDYLVVYLAECLVELKAVSTVAVTVV